MRALIVGGGRRGLGSPRSSPARATPCASSAARRLHDPDILAVGAEPWRGDPDRVGTLRYALDNVTLLLWLLGTATGDPEQVAALHGSRLEMMLERTVDTTVRGVVYEALRPAAGRRVRLGVPGDGAGQRAQRGALRAARGRPADTAAVARRGTRGDRVAAPGPRRGAMPVGVSRQGDARRDARAGR